MIDTYSILKEIPLFSDLNDQEFKSLEERCSFIEYKKGEIIYQQGSPPSAFYCIILGRVVIYTQDESGRESILEYLHRGKYFGIISLLTGDSHSVTAKAINDCLILTIKDEDFSLILKKIPSISIDLSRTLSRRLKRKSLHPKTIFESTVISVFSLSKESGKSAYALNLALSLTKETHKSVAIAEICYQDKTHSLPQRLEPANESKTFDLSSPVEDITRLKEFMIKDKSGVEVLCLEFNQEDESFLKKLVDILSLFTNDYHYIILDLPSGYDQSVLKILNQSDLVHILINPLNPEIKANHAIVEQLLQECHFQEEKIRVIINHPIASGEISEGELNLLSHAIFASLPYAESSPSGRIVLDAPAVEYSKAIRRISRLEGDCQVGLVLGVGVAYGFCHIGVLKVIEEKNIPIDIISGSSIGALIACLWACGRSSREILQMTKEFKEPRYIWELVDFTFPLLGFIKGNKLYAFLKKYVGNKTFRDLKIPLKIVASDVKAKESKVFDRGLLADAIMASCSMPGVFMPFKVKEEMLLDGGVIYPLPTEPLFEIGVKKIIAVNVTPSREDILRQYEKIKSDHLPRPKKVLGGLKGFLKEKLKTNILEIIFNSIEIMQSEVAKKEAQLADIVLHPDMSGLHWLEFQKADEFVKRGEEEIRGKLDKIWAMINE